MTDAAEVVDALIDTLNENRIDGFAEWREVGPQEWSRRSGRRSTAATAYFEIVVPGGDTEAVHAIAERETVVPPVFDDGAAADRAREIALDRDLGVTP